jgi:hypothetical protein
LILEGIVLYGFSSCEVHGNAGRHVRLADFVLKLIVMRSWFLKHSFLSGLFVSFNSLSTRDLQINSGNISSVIHCIWASCQVAGALRFGIEG